MLLLARVYHCALWKESQIDSFHPLSVMGADVWHTMSHSFFFGKQNYNDLMILIVHSLHFTFSCQPVSSTVSSFFPLLPNL